MKTFLAGVLVTVFIPLVAAFIFFKLGLMAVNADAQPGSMERRIANMSLNAAVERNAPKQDNPVPLNDENMIKGVKLYKENCSGCHGGPEGPSDFGLNFYPPAPQFSKRGLHDPDGNVFYVIKHGIRLTGMPAFGSETHCMLKDDQIWTLVCFLKNLQTLSPAVQDVWKAAPAPAPSASASPAATASPSTGASASPAARGSASPDKTSSPKAGATGSPAAAASGIGPSSSPSGDDDDDK